jgi:hypothetical protein
MHHVSQGGTPWSKSLTKSGITRREKNPTANRVADHILPRVKIASASATKRMRI